MMSLCRRLCELAARLQEPQKVARFQRLCGVQAPGEKAEAARRRPNGVLAASEREPEPEPEPPRSGAGAGAGAAIRSPRALFFSYLFRLGTALGNEPFYTLFFPSWLWTVDAAVGRRLVVIWVLVMYLGQSTKDVLRRPRPASPPVVQLEARYACEYGMPSTHAMSATAIPVAMVLLTYGRYQYPLLFGLILIACWCSLVCLSRIYLGMHSILDIIVGFLYTLLILAVFYPFVDVIDHFNQTHKYAPLLIIGLHLALGIFSFTLDTWSTSRGDTAEILGSGAGIACGSHVSNRIGLILDPPLDQLPLARPPITVTLLGKAILRILLGMTVVVIVRYIMKKVTIPLACKIFNIPSDDIRKARQHMEVELPYRYITYGMVGFAISFLVPYMFSCIGIS